MAETGAGIPKIIHQMWIGDNPKPTEWIKTFEDFCKEHGYQHILWTEDNLGQLEWDTFPGLKALYDSFDKIYNAKSDVLRYLALYSKGGIYIDADMVVVKPQQFADFLRDNTAPIFFGYEELTPGAVKQHHAIQGDLIEGNKLVASSVVASKAKHPFMEAACREIMENEKREHTQDAWISVGPLFITRHYNKYKVTYPDIKVYPMKYFFPIKWHSITDPELHKKIDMPPESMLFQYGYTTNNFAKIFRERGQKGGRRRRRTRRRRHRSKRKQASRQRRHVI
jgi:mannosyltransferase OCH1-like enzyme